MPLRRWRIDEHRTRSGAGIWCVLLAGARRIGVAALSRLRYGSGAESPPAGVTALRLGPDRDPYEGLIDRPEW